MPITTSQLESGNRRDLSLHPTRHLVRARDPQCDIPHGTLIPGSPARLPPSVSTSHRYIDSGSSVRDPMGNATTGDVALTMASHLLKASSKSRLIRVRTFCAFR